MFTLFVMIMMAGCGEQLTRDDAASILQGQWERKQACVSVERDRGRLKFGGMQDGLRICLERLDLIKQSGTRGPTYGKYPVYSWTDKAKAQGIGAGGKCDFPGTERVFGAVTGIVDESDVKRVVEFRWNWRPLVNADVQKCVVQSRGLGGLYSPGNLDTTEVAQTSIAVMVKFDDGWRLDTLRW